MNSSNPQILVGLQLLYSSQIQISWLAFPSRLASHRAAEYFQIRTSASFHLLSLEGTIPFPIENLILIRVSVEEEWSTIIRKGAYLAQDELAFEREREDGLELKVEERKALHQEEHDIWNQPFILYALVGCCSLGAAVQGW